MSVTTGSKSAIIISSIISKLEIVVGGLLTFFFGIGLIGCLTDESLNSAGTIIVILVLLLLSIFLLYRGIRRGRMIKLFKSYVTRLSTDATHSIDLLAEGTGTSVDVVKRNLQQMIKKRYFANAYIDTQQNRIVFPQQATIKTSVSAEPSAAGPDTEYETVTCKGCGAANKIAKGSGGECEFCGCQLK